MKPDNRPNQLVKIIILFAVLTAVGVGMATGSRLSGDQSIQAVLMSIGSAIFGSGLAFFLIEMFRWERNQ